MYNWHSMGVSFQLSLFMFQLFCAAWVVHNETQAIYSDKAFLK